MKTITTEEVALRRNTSMMTMITANRQREGPLRRRTTSGSHPRRGPHLLILIQSRRSG